MKTITKLAMTLIFLTLVIDILIRLTKPTPLIVNGLISGTPIISSWIDVVLAVEFGIPVAMELYSRFL
jgi:hypothetical protein